MPYAKRQYRKRKTYRKGKRVTRRFRKTFRRRTIARLGVVPHETTVRMRYVDQILINPAIDSLATYAFRANSLYDPNYTGVGHQPLGYDQAATLYERYCVVASKITVKLASQTTDNGYLPTIFGIYQDNDSTPPSSAQAMIEQGRCKHRIITANPNASNSSTVLTSSYSAKKYYGYKDFRDAKDSISSAMGGNPGKIRYFVLFAEPLDPNLADIPPLPVLVQIDFIVKLMEPNDLSQS